MPAEAIALIVIAATIDAGVMREPGLHPAALATIRGWLADMRTAADASDAREVDRLAQMTLAKVELERDWARG